MKPLPDEQGTAAAPDPDSLEAARAAFAAQDWAAAYEGFVALRGRDVLTAEDLHVLGESAWWLGRIDVCLEAFEAAYYRFLGDDQPIRAAMSAFYLAIHSMSRGDAAHGGAWLARVRQLVADDPETAPQGYVHYLDIFSALGRGDFAEAEARAQEMEALGRRLADPNLAALGVLGRGRVLVKKGQVEAGMALLDDAMLEALSGRLDPTWAGTIYCHLMDVCHELADVRRAFEWTLATSRWCDKIPDANLYPGICRVHRAQVMQVQGDWKGAESEADRAYRDMLGVHVGTAAGGQYEIGEIRRLRGDFTGAEQAYKRAHELGRDPQPGLALLRLAQERIDLAVASMRAALDATADTLARARLCVAHVEIALAAADIGAADTTASELERTAVTYSSPGLLAAAKRARGAVLAAQGRAPEALVELREACRRWQEVEAPYEAARTRLLLADAHRALADEDAVTLELDAADAVFRRLGADWDARCVANRRAEATLPAGLTHREVEVLQLVAAGRSNREIATELFVSERTVHRHMSNILAKLELPSRAAATAFAYEHGLVSRHRG